MPPKRVILFTAVSTPEQAKSKRESLKAQRRDLEAHFAGGDYTIIDVIEIPGHSRDYYTFSEFARAMQRKADMLRGQGQADRARKYESARRMYAHWKARDFDIMGIWSGNRIGRQLSILSEVVRRTVIGAGAKIYDLEKGEVNRQNYLMYSAFTGLASESEVTNLREKHRMGTRARVQRGGSYAGTTSWSHKEVPHPDNKSWTLLKVDRRHQRIFDAIYDLLVNRGSSYVRLPAALFGEYGIVNPETGLQFKRSTLEYWLYNPNVWGNTTKGARASKTALAYLDERYSEDKRANIEVFYGVIESVYQGEQRERLLAEIERRQSRRGRTGVYTHALSGTCVCDTCGHVMVYHRTNTKAKTTVYRALRCSRAAKTSPTPCPRPQQLSERKTQAQITAILRAASLAGDPNVLLKSTDDAQDNAAALAAIDTEIEQVRAQMKRAITLALGDTGNSEFEREYADMVQEQRKQLSARFDALLAQRKGIVRRDTGVKATRRRMGALDEIAKNIDILWTQDEKITNQWLREFLGEYGFSIRGGRVIGLRLRKRPQR